MSNLIHEKMLLVQKDIEAISKDRTNPQGAGYKFRGIDDLYNAVHTVFSKHGVYSVPTVLEREREERQSSKGGTLLYTILKILYTFYASDGSKVEALTIGEAMDSGDKSCNKAMSAAHKYCLIQVFSIPTEGDNDTENSSHELAPKPKPVPSIPAPLPKPLPVTVIDDATKRSIWTELTEKLLMSEKDAKDFLALHSGKPNSNLWNTQDLERVRNAIERAKNDKALG